MPTHTFKCVLINIYAQKAEECQIIHAHKIQASRKMKRKIYKKCNTFLTITYMYTYGQKSPSYYQC